MGAFVFTAGMIFRAKLATEHCWCCRSTYLASDMPNHHVLYLICMHMHAAERVTTTCQFVDKQYYIHNSLCA